MKLSHQTPAGVKGLDIERGLEGLADLMKQLGCRRILLVADHAAYEQSGAREVMQPFLSGFHLRVLTDFEPNPDETVVLQAVAAREEFQPDTVIGLGGGTALDIAKLACVCSSPSNAPSDVLRGIVPPQPRGVRLIAVPTTAGSGSEATHFAAVYCDGVKHSVAHPSLVPDVAWLDPRLTYSLPPSVTAAAGLDAFCQAMESLWSVAGTEESSGWAFEALSLAWENLARAVHRPDAASRAAMMRAAHLAGKSINASKTTACHAMSYALTSRYGVMHGLAVALALAPIMQRVAEVTPSNCNHPLGVAHVRGIVANIVAALGAESAADAGCKVRSLIRSLGCPTTLREVGVRTADEIQALAAEVNAERLGNFPLKITQGEIEAILHSVF